VFSRSWNWAARTKGKESWFEDSQKDVFSKLGLGRKGKGRGILVRGFSEGCSFSELRARSVGVLSSQWRGLGRGQGFLWVKGKVFSQDFVKTAVFSLAGTGLPGQPGEGSWFVSSCILRSMVFSELGLGRQGAGCGFVDSLERGFLWAGTRSPGHRTWICSFSGAWVSLGHGFLWAGTGSPGHMAWVRGFSGAWVSLGWNWAARAQGVDSWILWSVGFSGLGLDHQGTGRGYVVSLERGFLWGMGFSGLGLGHQGTWRGFVASLGWNWAARAQGVDSWILWSVGFSGAWDSLERGFL